MDDCSGGHRYFVAETAGVDAGGSASVHLFLVCINCGDPLHHKFVVSDVPAVLKLTGKKE